MELSTNLNKLHKYLCKALPNVESDLILSILLAKLSQVAMLNKVKAGSVLGDTLVNNYILNFSPSGTGKDYTISKINELLFNPYFKEFNLKQEEYINIVKDKLMSQYTEEELQKKKVHKEIESNLPRKLVDTFQDATLEGFLSMRKEFERAGFGGTLVSISEFSDYILSDSTSRDQFLSIIKDVYQDGNNLAKVIKMEKVAEKVENVPCSILFQSTPTGLLKGNGAIKLLSFLNKGIARRSLICYSKGLSEYAELSFEKYFKIQKSLKEDSVKLQKILNKSININPDKNIYYLTEIAEEHLYNYLNKNAKKALEEEQESIRSEMNSRYNKAIKLSGLIALIEHPNEQSINIEDVRIAISIVEHFSIYLKQLLIELTSDANAKLTQYFINNVNKAISKSQLRQEKFVSNPVFTKWVNEAIEEIKPLLMFQGYELIEQNIGSIGKQYILKEIRNDNKYIVE